MKKLLIGLLIASVMVFAGCKKEDLTIGASPVPHAQLLELIKDDLKAQGIALKIVEFTDYVQPNIAVMSGDLDANFFQHLPYLESNSEWTSELVPAFGVHIEPFGLYSSKHNSISDIPDGASIAIPNDPSNGGRALLLLHSQGLITLKSGGNLTATVHDISSNPRNFRFEELEAAQLPRSLQDVDAAMINGNYALEAGFNPLKDALIIEGADSPYVNIVVVQKGKSNDSKIIALREAMLSQKVKDYIDSHYNGGVTAIF